MRAVIQRVERASVSVEGEIRGRIGAGFLVLIGVEEGDGDADFRYIAEKVPNLRVFEDEQGKMNRSLLDVGGEVLAVSQFTLLGDARGGRRPPRVRRRPTPCTSGWWRTGARAASGWRRACSART